MFLFADQMRAELDYYRIVSILGERGAGKDLLTHHLAMPYLQAGYKFYSNQFSLWNDDLWRVPQNDFERDHAFVREDGKKYFPDVHKRVIVLSEAGRYLREYRYFEDMIEYARKLKNYFFFPSVRASHEDLLDFTIHPVLPFKPFLGIEGGVWAWTLDNGLRHKKGGLFVFYPEKDIIGVYDTEDFTENPDKILQAIRSFVEVQQKIRGRDGIQTVAGVASGQELDAQAKIARRLQQASAALSRRRR